MSRMASDPLALFDEIQRDVADKSRQIVEKIAIDVQDRISVPVGYKIGPRGGTTKIRSKPGEPPRKDTGKLKAGVQSDVIEASGQIAASVFDEVPYAEPLEDKHDRPIMTDLMDTYEDLYVDGLAQAAEGNL